MRALSVLALLVLASGCTLLAPARPDPVLIPSSTPSQVADPTPDAPSCAALALSLDRDVLRPGENMTINVTLTNCGQVDFLEVFSGGGACGTSRSLTIEMDDAVAAYFLDDQSVNGTPHGRFPLGSCGPMMDSQPRYLVPPGRSVTDSHSWDGTLSRPWLTFTSSPQSFGFEGRFVDEPARNGTIHLSASYDVENGTSAYAEANLTVDAPRLAGTRLLLVREWDWANGTVGENIHPSAEPDPTGCEVRLDDRRLVLASVHPVDDYAVLRQRANRTNEYHAWGPTGGGLGLPWPSGQGANIEFSVTPSGGFDFLVQGEENVDLLPGATHAFRYHNGDGDQVLEATNVGYVQIDHTASCTPATS